MSDIKDELENWLKNYSLNGFFIARMSKVRFGIVDPDRARFLGLTFEVNILPPSGGGASLYIPKTESLDLIEKYGSQQGLERKLCWVKINNSVVNFVKVIDE